MRDFFRASSMQEQQGDVEGQPFLQVTLGRNHLSSRPQNPSAFVVTPPLISEGSDAGYILHPIVLYEFVGFSGETQFLRYFSCLQKMVLILCGNS